MEKLNNAKRKVFLSYAFKDFDKIKMGLIPILH